MNVSKIEEILAESVEIGESKQTQNKFAKIEKWVMFERVKLVF